jgi:ribosomal protein S18 acetylase RimI-like enzyme
MKVVVRPLENTDLQEDLTKLRILARPDDPSAYDADWQSRVWRWLESHPLADRMHRWVVDAEGKIVGHLGALPQYYRINGQRVVAHTPSDYMVLPEYGFYAITLMRKFFRTCENCVACDAVPEAISVETKLGAEEAGRLQPAAKLSNVAGVPAFPTSIPAPITQLLNWGLQAVDRALTATMLVDHLRVEVLGGFDASFDELFESVTAAVPCVPEKDAAFLRWRYGPGSPQSPVTVLGVRDGEALLGYAVLRITREGDTGYVLDLTTLPGRRDVGRSLLREAIRHFARAGVYIIRYRFLESPTAPRAKDVWRLGFFPVYKRRHTLLVKFADQGLHKTALDTDNWSYTTGDGEASFWVR